MSYFLRDSTVPFKVLYTRPLITDVSASLGRVRPFGEMQYWGVVWKDTAINWPSQSLQTVLITAFFVGLWWVSRWAPSPSSGEGVSKDKRFMNRLL